MLINILREKGKAKREILFVLKLNPPGNQKFFKFATFFRKPAAPNCLIDIKRNVLFKIETSKLVTEYSSTMPV
jgi:hypothetical protein